MRAILAQRLEWLSAFPQKKRLMIWFVAALLLAFFPILPVSFFALNGIQIRWLIIFAALYELILVCALFLGIVLPLIREIYTIMLASNTSSKSLQKGPFLASLREIAAYIKAIEERQDRVQLLQKQAELDALQSQINPHFLYNTLDTIRGQALEEGCQIAPDMIEALSTLLRYTISHRDDMVPLRQELRSIENYMKIQKFRFSNRFSYVTKIEDDMNDLLALRIPKLTLQPLIENAIFHGIESLLSGGLIQVEIYTTQSRLVINVTDNGVGMDEEQLQRLREKLASSSFTPLAEASPRGSGLAITNVNARIQLLFGQKYGVQVFSTKGIGSQFQVSLPTMEKL